MVTVSIELVVLSDGAGVSVDAVPAVMGLSLDDSEEQAAIPRNHDARPALPPSRRITLRVTSELVFTA